jgi:hypothetical protein
MTFKRLLGLATAMVAVAVLVGSVGAGAARTPAKPALKLSTNAKVRDYLRSLGISPRGVVIQRSARNYAGPNCPGKRWRCTSTKHVVVQVAATGGKNMYSCTGSNCAVIQVAAAPTATNTAKCIKTTGLAGTCTINQSSTSANNVAIVLQVAAKMSGLTQSATYSAQITQRTTGAGAFNKACVLQLVNIDASTVARRGTPVSVNLAAHQTANITQDSATGDNTVQAATTSTTGACAAAGSPLKQTQILTSTASGGGPITQNQNSVDTGPNIALDIKQNQSTGFFGTATGKNVAKSDQTNTLSAIANTPVGPVNQTQSAANGGILARVNQDSRDISTANATQTETQCEDAHTTAESTCHTANPDPPGYSLTQTQFGPMRKDLGDSSQTGNNGDSFTVIQNSQQDNDTQSGQTNVISGGFHTDGTGTVSQTATVNGQTSTNNQGGSGDVSGNMNCTGSTCTSTPQPSANVLIAGTGDFGSTEPNDNLTQALTSAGYSVTESAALPPDLSSFSQVWWVDATPPTSGEQSQLISFAESGKGVFLTGENDSCCSSLNAADHSMVNTIVSGGGITVGGQDVCCAGTPVPYPVNSGVVGNLATRPHTVTSWTATFPGDISDMPDSSVFAYYQPGDITTRQVVAAAWDRSSTVGNGRLVVFMDINWTEAAWRAANWSDVAENVAFFLSGLTSPPTPPILQAPAAMVPAGPSLFGAQAQVTPARATTPTALSGASNTR